MRAVLRFFFFLLFNGFFNFTFTQAQSLDPVWVKEKILDSQTDFRVPNLVWTLMRETLEEEGHSAEELSHFSISPIEINAKLQVQRDHQKVLKFSKNHGIFFSKGGGTLDFSKYVVGGGAFRLSFEPLFPNPATFHLLYISQSPGLKVEGENWGNGCGQIYDLSASVDFLTQGQGAPLTTKYKQYLHLLSGTLVFYQFVEGFFYLGYVYITDSRYPQFRCQ